MRYLACLAAVMPMLVAGCSDDPAKPKAKPEEPVVLEWSVEQVLPSANIKSIWGLSESSFYAITEDAIHHFDGESWSELNAWPGNELTDVWAGTPTDIVVTGMSGNLFRYDGTEWTQQNPSTRDITSVWAMTGGETYITLADGGGVLSFNGTGWAEMEFEQPATHLNSIHGRSARDIFAVGDGGIVINYKGSNWDRQRSNTEADLVSVWAIPLGNVLAVSATGQVMFYRRLEWEHLATFDGVALTSVWAGSNDDIYVVGKESAAFHYDGIEWFTPAIG